MLISNNYSSYLKQFSNKKYLLTNYTYKINKKNQYEFNSLNYFNIYFIKKERLYTKLKYSRVPQFDVASGGIASLVAAMFACLVTEKFGVELVDSGDFYTILMYLIFILFVIKTVSNLFDTSNNSFVLTSFNNVFKFYKKIFIIVISFIKK